MSKLTYLLALIFSGIILSMGLAHAATSLSTDHGQWFLKKVNVFAKDVPQKTKNHFSVAIQKENGKTFMLATDEKTKEVLLRREITDSEEANHMTIAQDSSNCTIECYSGPIPECCCVASNGGTNCG